MRTHSLAALVSTLLLMLVSRPSQGTQEADSLEAQVLEMLVGKEGELYVHAKPDYVELLKVGEKAIPILLSHASDSDKAYKAVCKTLFVFSRYRMSLPALARDWLLGQIGREKPNLYAIQAIGELGLAGRIPRLTELAKGRDEATACVSVQAIGAIGGEKAQEALEQLKGSILSDLARSQCVKLLDTLYYPFLGDGADGRKLQAIETSTRVSLKYSWGGLHPFERLLRQLAIQGRRDLVPGVRDIASRMAAKDSSIAEEGSYRFNCILLTLKILDSAISQEEKRLLEKVGYCEHSE